MDGVGNDGQEDARERGETSDEEQEAREYLETVLAELSRREALLAALDEEISNLEYEERQLGSGRRMFHGRAAQLAASQRHRSMLRRRIDRKRRVRKGAVEDVMRAKERKQLAEEELREIAGLADEYEGPRVQRIEEN